MKQEAFHIAYRNIILMQNSDRFSISAHPINSTLAVRENCSSLHQCCLSYYLICKSISTSITLLTSSIQLTLTRSLPAPFITTTRA